MIWTQKFLLLILLCWPLVGFADSGGKYFGGWEEYELNVNDLSDDISKQKSIGTASAALLGACEQIETYYAESVAAEIIKAGEQKCRDAIAAAKNCQEYKPEPDAVPVTSVTPKVCPDDSTGTYPDCECIDEDMKYDSVKNKCIVDELKKKQKAYDEAKATEQSKANRTLTALTTAATGIGGMELAMGLAQQAADAYADQSMAAYFATMRCTYGRTQQVRAGPDEIELPGGNDADMMKLRAEYFALAKDLKERKEALGMKPGIESEVIMDKSQTGLYDDENLGIDSGAYASLYRAQMLGSEVDKQKIEEERKASQNRVIAGGVLVGAGVVGGIVGNAIINRKQSKADTDVEKLIDELCEKGGCDADTIRKMSTSQKYDVIQKLSEISDLQEEIDGSN